MEVVQTEPVDFVKEFQEYLTQQTQHVNMISGSVCGEKDTGEPFQPVAPRCEQNGLDPPSVEVSLSVEDGLERTCDGKYKCSYCSYGNKGMARLIEHIRIHTGEKPYRCQLCPFASAYERHLEAHMRSHTGEKPYKCDLCSFRCSDRSNLSHHRRRRHKLLPTRGVRSPFASKRVLGALQKRTSSLGFGRRLHMNFNSPSMVMPKSNYSNDSTNSPHHLNDSEYNNPIRMDESDALHGEGNELTFKNPLTQLSSLAGQLTDLHPEEETPTSPDRESLRDEKPILITQHVSGEQATVCVNGIQTSPPKEESPSLTHPSCSPVHALGFNTTNAPIALSVSQPGTPTPAAMLPDQQLLHKCQHCDTHFSDNILFTIHMGCHSYEHPFQCNICGHQCIDRYDFACHFARGQHKK